MSVQYIIISRWLLQGVPKKLVRFAAKTTFFNTISLIAFQTAQVFLGHSVYDYRIYHYQSMVTTIWLYNISLSVGGKVSI